ncbi:MAG: alkaline phosphatase family protein [Candidatus Omnitrophica bacterium]|nr:alkaline phosphatase family protein [Candidatus Omnitrophota bacterium]
MGRTVFIGLDGVPHGLLKRLADDGTMPHCRRLFEIGNLHCIASTIPDISSVAWSSIITGKNPAEHGIFGFVDIPINTYRISFPNYLSLKSKPFWEKSEGRSVILNVPSTFPVREMNGVHISGFVSLDLERSVYPPGLLSQVKALDYKVDVDAEKAHVSMDMFLSDLDKTLTARGKVCDHLWQHEKWDTFMIVFTGTDRLMHFLWDAYEDEEHWYYKAFRGHFSKVDAIVGSIIDRLNDNDILVMCSDHGMEHLDKNVYVNAILKEHGFLHYDPALKGGFANIDGRTKAFSLDPARIYLNKRGKFPRGCVAPNDEEKIIEDICELFQRYAVGGKAVCKAIYRKKEIFHGPFIDLAPDIVLIGNEGINLHSGLTAENTSEETIFSGKHTQHDAFLYVRGRDKCPSVKEGFNVSNIIGYIDSLKAERWR